MQAATARASVLHHAGATQAVSQGASQVVTQDGAGRVRTVSCTVDGKNDHQAYGTRAGNRRQPQGERAGSLAGRLTGNLDSGIPYQNKGKTGQWTGFYLKNFAAGSPSFSPIGSPVWDDEATYPKRVIFRRRTPARRH